MRIAYIALLIGTLSVCSASDVPSATFAWGSSEFIAPGPSDRRVSYQGESTSLLESLVGGLLGGGALTPAAAQYFRVGAARPDVTVIFLGSKVDASSAANFAHVTAALDAAPASVSLPFTHHEGAGSMQARLAADAGSATLHRVGSCEGAAAAPLAGHPLPDLSTASAAGAGSSPVAVLVCASEADALEDQAAVLQALGEAVAAAGARHMFVYASEPAGPAAVGAQRTLLAKSAERSGVAAPSPKPAPGQLVCDARCKTQVNQLEAGLLLIVLIVALGFGTYCMGILDTPTRFESVKDDNR
jgi:hypothetical protein